MFSAKHCFAKGRSFAKSSVVMFLNFLICGCDTVCLKLKVFLYRFKSAHILNAFNIVMPHKLNHRVACFFKTLN